MKKSNVVALKPRPKSNVVSMVSHIPKGLMKCKITISHQDDVVTCLVNPPMFFDTTEGRELLTDYMLIIMERIFEEDERVKKLFMP